MKLDEALAIDIVDETPEQIESSTKPKLNENITFDSDDDVLPKDILPIGFISKPKPADEEIFDDKVEKVVKKVQESDKTPEIKLVKEEVKEEVKEPSISLHGIPTVKLTKRGKVRKPMSEEHKAKLAIAREKAMIKKKYLANERKIAKMKEQKENQSKKDEDFSVLQAKQKIEMEKLEKIERDKEAAAVAASSKNNNSAITRADLEDITMKSLIAMETMRKKRKAEKKKARAEQEYQQEVMQTIKKASPSWMIEGSVYNDCF